MTYCFQQVGAPAWGAIVNAKDAGKIMQGHRKRKGLTQDQVVERSSVPTPQYLSALENGRYDVRNSEHFKSLVALYGLTSEQVMEVSPDALITVAPEPAPRRPGPPSVAPVVPFRETRITIPRELQEMVEQHGDAYPVLKTEQMQQMLAAPRNFGGAEVGPQTAEDWFDYWMANKRFLT